MIKILIPSKITIDSSIHLKSSSVYFYQIANLLAIIILFLMFFILKGKRVNFRGITKKWVMIGQVNLIETHSMELRACLGTRLRLRSQKIKFFFY